VGTRRPDARRHPDAALSGGSTSGSAAADPAVSEALAAGPGWPADDRPADGPLRGIRVLDLSRVLAGPFATMVLADLGADVVKVERPGTGDDTRRWGPPFHPDADGDAAYFLSVNRNRRSLALDLTTPDGAAVCTTLAGHADVVVENFLPRHLERLGLDRVRAARRHAVWVSVRGAGSGGPAGQLPGYDVMVQARSGLMGVTGFPETGPTKVGVAIADVITGLYAAVSALAGIIGRQTGGGPVIEVPLLESAISALVNQAANHLIGGTAPGPLGNAHPNLAPYGPVACADRQLVIGAGNDRQFAALCAAIGHPEVAADPRFATNADRVTARAALDEVLARIFATRDAGAWRTELEAAGVPCAPVNAMGEVFTDPHVEAVGLVEEIEHDGGTLPLVGSPLLVDGARPPIRRPPPRLGEHTDAVLHALGLDGDAVAALRSRGAVA
jgi:crotonobetainyl-CoA:carnitine CoA-transferase CaiB-like acyl-CoA transferase